MPRVEKIQLSAPDCGDKLYGLNSDGSILATSRGQSRNQILFSTHKGGDDAPFFFVSSNWYIREFMWHRTNPFIFVTCEEGNLIFFHTILQNDEGEYTTTIMIAQIDIGEFFSSICMNQDGSLMVVRIPEKTHAFLFQLSYEDGGVQFSRLPNQKISGDYPIESVALFDNWIAIVSENPDFQLSVRQICPQSGERLRNIIDLEDLGGNCLSCSFSKDGQSFVVLYIDKLALYSFSRECMSLKMIQIVPLVYDGWTFRWHPELPMLVVLSKSGVLETVQFFKVSKDGLYEIYCCHYTFCLTNEFFMDKFSVIFGYSTLFQDGCSRISIHFEDLVHFPVEKMLSVQKTLIALLQNDDLVERICRQSFESHLSFERFVHLIQSKP
jgi:hypothetical protein